MPSIDMPLDELRRYKPPVSAQHDFWAFWNRGLETLRREEPSVNVSVKAVPFKGFDVYDVDYLGAGGAVITGELVVPEGARDAPGLVVYHGYSRLHAPAHQVLHWAAMGAVVLSVDVRGQRGRTRDSAAYPGPRSPGFMTAGIADPDEYYYRHVYLDCVRAVDVLASREEVDAERLAVAGASQGGGLSLAVAALEPRVALCMAEVPFLCDFPRALRVADGGPYLEIAEYCRFAGTGELERVMRTLSYFDNVNLAGHVAARTLLSAGLCDGACPPSTVFAVFNHLACSKRIEPYPCMKHEMNPEFAVLCMEEMDRQFDL